MKFVEFNKREYHNGYCSVRILVSISDITRIVECVDDYSHTTIVTKDGEIFTLNERYADVIKKIREAVAADENEG